MIGRIEAFIRKLRRGLSRSEWLARLLRLPRSAGPATEPGLVLIQIDGLAHSQLSHGLKQGGMPFLQRLIKRERYRLHPQYAGIPSTTAAVQAELFYGIKAAVPGFNFMERASGKLVRMFEPEITALVESKLEKYGAEPLLKGGSAYVDNYTGGAAEAHFCPNALGWGPSLRESSPLVFVLLIISNAHSFVRTAALLVLETMLALVDCIRGLIDGHDLIAELKFVPTRVVIAILLRELAVIGVKIDIARGLPIIHLNFLGYDEQAHRRGPSSEFAHWTLKGIDDAIARIWRAAQRSAHRHYDVWIYSDHGQQYALPYHQVHGRSLAEAVAELCTRQLNEPVTVQSNGPWGIQLHRVQFLGGKKIQRLLPVRNNSQAEVESPQLTVAALGPVAMIYRNGELASKTRAELARDLVEDAGIPLVLIKDAPNRARAWTEAGEFMLPEDSIQILGADHPFLEEASQDLIKLCHHPEAGEFIACGWRADGPAYTFAIEHGAHGGISPEETTAFALLPNDAPLPLPTRQRGYLRTADLRQAALHLLGRTESRMAQVRQWQGSVGEVLRIMTYNVHSCIGMDGQPSPERIARVIACHRPDVVALQELDVGRARTGGIDQVRRIAASLEMNFHFHPARYIGEGRYGNAVLSRLPMRLIKAAALPRLSKRPELESRGALWVEIEFNGMEIQVINTHLGLSPRERQMQVQALLGAAWLQHPSCRSPAVLCGDFNARPSSAICRQLRQRLQDAQLELSRYRPRSTFFGRFPTARLDYIFIDSGIEVLNVEVPRAELSRLASDHLPLIVEMRIPARTHLSRSDRVNTPESAGLAKGNG
ncbi:Oxidoreductase [Candidatus Methylobacter favarea]|uniref:Oxidoreductase n=1 Tax=Candidatus Methylobacter favarea TaxID=2707345 RepID=A0A8S0WKQ1_9GAMM|nr:Oxidoreductase [Candidatus Methylobacter favarea]